MATAFSGCRPRGASKFSSAGDRERERERRERERGTEVVKLKLSAKRVFETDSK